MSGSTPASATADQLPAEATGLAIGGAATRDGPRIAGRLRTPAAIIGIGLGILVLLVAALADVIAPGDPFASVDRALAAPSAAHILGTDDLGRDLYTGVVHGIRTTIVVALGVALLALPLGLLMGSLAGTRGGWLDDTVMRFAEIWQVMPRFFLALMVIALFGPGLDRIILVLGLTSWALLARIVRAEILSLREREFVEAAQVLGARQSVILRDHLLPHVLPAAIVYVALLLAQVCLIEASLGFLGLSDPNAISLGYLASQAQPFLRVAWWMWLFPGISLIAVVISLNLVADTVTDRIRHTR